MTLKDVIASLNEYDGEQTIYVRDAQPHAEECVICENDKSVSAQAPDEMHYFLEVSMAKEVLAVWSEWRSGCLPTIEEKMSAIIHYATYDSFLPVQ